MWRQLAGPGNTTSIQCRHQKPDGIRVSRPHRQKEGEFQEEEQQAQREQIRRQRSREEKSGKHPTVNHWLEPFVSLWGVHSVSQPCRRRNKNLSSVFLRANPLGLFSVWTEEDSRHRQHVPCHCHLPLHAVDSAEHRGRLWGAHRLHEHRLAGRVSAHSRRRLRPPWGHRGRRGLQAHVGHLRPLHKAAAPAARNTVRSLRHPLRGDCQRVLAGHVHLPGSGDPAAVRRGLHLGLHHVLPEHHEEEHL